MTTGNENILISIVIPVKNGVSWLDACMKGIMQQTLFAKSEIIILDSGSDDGTLELLKKYPVTVYNIPPASFNHGDTRNFGVEKSNGKYVVMTVQDAVPSSENWLQELINGFVNDDVAGVCGQQIVPHDADKNPVQWFRPVNGPALKEISFSKAAEFDSLPPLQKVKLCGWDDVTACYRREILLNIPFEHVTFAEDALWAKAALRAGYTIVYNTAARVFHYHHEEPDFTFKRNLTVNYFRYSFFEFVPPKPVFTFKRKLQIIKMLQREKISPGQKLYWWKYNVDLYNARKRAYDVFSAALGKGEDQLDLVHEQYCGKAPMSKQKKSA